MKFLKMRLLGIAIRVSRSKREFFPCQGKQEISCANTFSQCRVRIYRDDADRGRPCWSGSHPLLLNGKLRGDGVRLDFRIGCTLHPVHQVICKAVYTEPDLVSVESDSYSHSSSIINRSCGVATSNPMAAASSISQSINRAIFLVSYNEEP